MSGDLDELYQSIILDQNRRPQNFRPMPGATARAEGVNPMCGDQFTVWLKLEGETVAGVLPGIRVRDFKGKREPHDRGRSWKDACGGRIDVHPVPFDGDGPW